PAHEVDRLGDAGRVERERERDVVEPRAGERARLDHRRDRDAPRALLALEPPDLDALVRLHVRPERDAEAPAAVRHPHALALEHVEVEEQRGRRERGERRRDRTHDDRANHDSPGYARSSRRTGDTVSGEFVARGAGECVEGDAPGARALEKGESMTPRKKA